MNPALKLHLCVALIALLLLGGAGWAAWAHHWWLCGLAVAVLLLLAGLSWLALQSIHVI